MFWVHFRTEVPNFGCGFAQITGGGGGRVTHDRGTTLGLPYTIGVSAPRRARSPMWTIAATGTTASGTSPITITGITSRGRQQVVQLHRQRFDVAPAACAYEPVTAIAR